MTSPGITEHLNHLQSLGITAIYLNPIFASPSNHKYNTTDYMKIDPSFGDDAAFRALMVSCLGDTGDPRWGLQ